MMLCMAMLHDWSWNSKRPLALYWWTVESWDLVNASQSVFLHFIVMNPPVYLQSSYPFKLFGNGMWVKGGTEHGSDCTSGNLLNWDRDLMDCADSQPYELSTCSLVLRARTSKALRQEGVLSRPATGIRSMSLPPWGFTIRDNPHRAAILRE